MSERVSGILLHPTSLPGPWGIGDLGPASHRILDWLEQAGQSVWQILPLGPTGGGDSPYRATSSFAGNPLLISPEALLAEDFLPRQFELGHPDRSSDPKQAVAYGEVAVAKEELLRLSWDYVRSVRGDKLQEELESFAEIDLNPVWLGSWTLYAALKKEHDQRPWSDWPRPVRLRHQPALAEARARLKEEIRFQTYLQFLFSGQWQSLHRRAKSKGIRLLGDLPIYVAPDSADVWVNQELFDLDESGRPNAVAGVPPDAFSETGQHWGNPLYRWDRMRDAGYSWWISRIRANLQNVDILRLDHFRGFAAYWSVPATAADAREGKWAPGPGAPLLQALERSLGDLPLIAEDLGVITPDVIALKEQFGLPGMKVLQFGFEEVDSNHLPHHHTIDNVVYTGTHDNDTSQGWYSVLDEKQRRRVRDYLGTTETDVHWGMIRAALTSVARMAVLPAQDLLGLGSEARMNTPAVAHGNWSWRLAPGQLDAQLAERLQRLTKLAGRLPESGS